MRKLNLEEFEKEFKEFYKGRERTVHPWNHIKRVAEGVKWFMELNGASKREQELAYIAALLHDVVRPETEKTEHALLSAKKARKILIKKEFKGKELEEMLNAIRNHSKKPEKWNNILHESVFFIDKVFEVMGAYVVFRRSMYIGASPDYKEHKKIGRFFIKHFKMKMEGKENKKLLNKKFKALVEYQSEWQERFVKAFDERKPWAMHLGEEFFEKGRREEELDKAIREFNPIYPEEKEYKKEAVDYLDGKKLKEFERLVKLGDEKK